MLQYNIVFDVFKIVVEVFENKRYNIDSSISIMNDSGGATMEFLKGQGFNILSIIISGMISWVVSAVYFYKGNRANLQSSVIFPLLCIISEPVSTKNLTEVKDISRNPLIRYFRKKEKKEFLKLVKEYRLVSPYNESNANATAIVSDFEMRLKRSGISPKCVPFEIGNGDIEYEYPNEINYLHTDIEMIFEKRCLETETDICTEQILQLLKNFTKEFYTRDISTLFKDYDVKDIIKNAEITDKWNWKFTKYNTAKQEFEDLKIVKKTKNIIDL